MTEEFEKQVVVRMPQEHGSLQRFLEQSLGEHLGTHLAEIVSQTAGNVELLIRDEGLLRYLQSMYEKFLAALNHRSHLYQQRYGVAPLANGLI